MKKIKRSLITTTMLVLLAFIAACGLKHTLPEKICDDQGSREESFLLKTAEKLVTDGKMSREDWLATTYYGMIRVGAIYELLAKERSVLEKWWRKVGEEYLRYAPDLSYADVIDYMTNKEKYTPEELRLIKLVLIPEVSSFKSSIRIKAWDDCILRKGHAHVGELFGWAPVTKPTAEIECFGIDEIIKNYMSLNAHKLTVWDNQLLRAGHEQARSQIKLE